MSKEELIKKYKLKIEKLNKYIESCELAMPYYEKRKEEGLEGLELYNSHYSYYMGLIIECNTYYDALDDLRKLEGSDN